MLTPADPAWMQSVVDEAMPDTAAFTRRSLERNEARGRDNTLVPVDGMDAVPCHVHPDTQRGASETEQQGALASEQRWRIMFPTGTDARPVDVVTIRGQAYELVQVDTDRSWTLEVEALAVRRG